MRVVLQGTIELLDSILNQTIRFKEANKNIYQNRRYAQEENRHTISIFASCILRHYYALHFKITTKFKALSELDKLYLMFALANNLFIKKYRSREVNDELKSYIISKKLPYDAHAICEYCDSQNDKKTLLDLNISKQDFRYFQLRYNLPVPLIKQFVNEFGLKEAINLIKYFYAKKENLLMVNTLADKVDNLEERYKGFYKSEIDGFYSYNGDKMLARVPAFAKGRIFASNPIYLELSKMLELDPLKNVAIYSDYLSEFIPTLNVTYHNMLRIAHLVSPKSIYYKYLDYVRTFGFENNSVGEGSLDCLEASLSEKVHTFVCMPLNSNYEQLKEEPDYFYFAPKANELDNLLAYQKDMLNAASKFVLPGGQLVYLIETCSKKESYYLIKDFLKEHKEFTLVYEKQYLPNEKGNIVLYAAILRKKEA